MISIGMASDYISTVEAAYRVGGPDERWLEEIAASALAYLDVGLGVMTWTFDISDDERPRISRPVIVGGLAQHVEVPARVLDAGGAPLAAAAYLESGPCVTAREAVERHQRRGEHYAGRLLDLFPEEAADFLAVLGSGPDGNGVLLGAPLPKVRKISPRTRHSLSQVASHLAAAFRLRQVLARSADLSSFAEAVFEPDGRCVDARGAAKSAIARERLRLAIRGADRARGRLRKSDSEAALESWHALVAGRWSLVDSFERGGRRYVVALRNDPHAPGLRALTLRERQVLGYAALGHSNKLIAYELGLAPSTVSSALKRGLARLGLVGRSELVAMACRPRRG